MKKVKYVSGLAISLMVLLGGAAAQNIKFKALDGKVLGNDDIALQGAIVYLENSKDSTIRTFISTQDGTYRFGQIAPDLDYTVWAKYKDAKSSTKTISAYDSRQSLTIDLHIKTNK